VPVEIRRGWSKATVTAWRAALEARKLGPISINVRITAVLKLAVEAADNGLLASELASGIARIKGVKTPGVRVGNWRLSLLQGAVAPERAERAYQEGAARPRHARYASRARIAAVRTGEPDYEARPAARLPLVHRGSGRKARAGADGPDALVGEDLD